MSLYMAMIPLNVCALPRGEDVRAELTRAWPKLKVGPAEAGDETFTIRVDSTDVIAGHMPAPIPWSDLEGPCETSMLFPNAAAALREHREHLILTVSGPEKPLEGLRTLTMATAAVLKVCPDAPGVFWTHAEHVVGRDEFLKFTETLRADIWPILIWVSYRVGQHPTGGSSGYTCGLASLGHRELEARNTPEDGVELRKRLHSLAEYLVENGPVINDQDTIGESATEQIRVVYADGTFGQTKPVMRLEYSESSAIAAGEEPSKKRMRITAYGYFHIVLTIATTIGFGYLLHGLASYLINSAWIRHLLLTIPILVFGLFFLLLIDKFLQKKFGLHAMLPVDE
jgi:hypothetical protein